MTARSLWAAGLIVGGVCAILFEGVLDWLLEWITGRDDLDHGGSRLVERLALAIGVVALLSGIALLVSRFVQ